jgi:hypothetical protein
LLCLEIMRAVSGVYCPHTTAFRSHHAGPPATFEVVHPGVQPVVELRYRAPVKVDAGKFPRLMLMQSCLEGSGTASQEDVTVTCRRGQTLPLSPGLDTQLEFDARFSQFPKLHSARRSRRTPHCREGLQRRVTAPPPYRSNVRSAADGQCGGLPKSWSG